MSKPKRAQILLNVSDLLKQALTEEAGLEELTVSEFIRQTMRREIDKRRAQRKKNRKDSQ